MSVAEEIFKSIKNLNDIERLIKEEREEGLYLEFKQKRDPGKSVLDRDDKRNFADALSQFANSDGGVQLWGIVTKGLNDKASGIRSISDPKIFAAGLKAYVKDATQPVIDGVLVEVIKEKRDKGFVKILIPQSDKTPHRSMATREYYKRNVNGKYRLEHFDLEDMFGRRQKPYLLMKFVIEEKHELDPKNVDEQGYIKPPLSLYLYITNEGRALGRDGMAVIWAPEERIAKLELKLIDAGVRRIDDIHGGKPTYQLNLRNSIFYPTVNTRLGELTIRVHKDSLDSDKTFLKWVIYADNMLPKNGIFNLLERKRSKKGGE